MELFRIRVSEKDKETINKMKRGTETQGDVVHRLILFYNKEPKGGADDSKKM